MLPQSGLACESSRAKRAPEMSDFRPKLCHLWAPLGSFGPPIAPLLGTGGYKIVPFTNCTWNLVFLVFLGCPRISSTVAFFTFFCAFLFAFHRFFDPWRFSLRPDGSLPKLKPFGYHLVYVGRHLMHLAAIFVVFYFTSGHFFAFCMLFADVPSVLSSQLVTKLCSVEYCAWHVAQNGSVSVCSGWNALAPWALPACRGPPEEVHSSVALYLPQSNYKASSPYIMKGLRSRPKVISDCSVHLQDLLYVVFNSMQRVLRTFVWTFRALNWRVIYMYIYIYMWNK